MHWRGPASRCLAVAALIPGLVHAGAGAYVVDDAGITSAGHCQVQSWLQWLSGGAAVLNTLPACSTGPVEWSLGVSAQDHPFQHQESPAIKWMIRDPEQHRFGIAANIGGTAQGGRWISRNGYLAMTWTPDDDKRWSVNADLGAISAPPQRWKMLVGLGVRYQLNERLSLIAERLQPWNRESINQLGVRWKYSHRASVDVLAGKGSASAQGAWLTVGWNVTF